MKYSEKKNSLKKGDGVPHLNFKGGPRVPLLNFEGSPWSQIPKSRDSRSPVPGPSLTPCFALTKK